MMGTLADITRNSGLLTDGDWVESKDQDTNGDVALIQLADIKDGYFKRKSSRRLTSGKAEKLNCTFLKKGDVLIARMPDPLGRCCIYTAEERKAVTVVDVCIVRTNPEKHNSNWLVHSINSPQFRSEINKLQSGTTRKRISKKNLALIQFPILPKKEQDLTVEIIETQFTRLDAAIKSLKTIKQKLEVYRKSVLKAAFEGELIEFNDIEINLISEYCEKVKKFNPKDLGIKEFYYIDIGSINNKQKTIENISVVESTNAPSRARQETLPGDIVYSTVRVYLMNLAIVPHIEDKKIISSTGFTVLRPSSRLNNKLLYYYLLQDEVTSYLSARQRGTSYPAIRDNDVFNMKIKIPVDMNIQKLIADEIESRFSVIDKLEEVIDNSLMKAERLRKSILKVAFEGKLVN